MFIVSGIKRMLLDINAVNIIPKVSADSTTYGNCNGRYQLSESIWYENFTGKPVTIIKRNGLRFTIESSGSPLVDGFANSFIIHHTFHHSRDVRKNAESLLNVLRKNNPNLTHHWEVLDTSIKVTDILGKNANGVSNYAYPISAGRIQKDKFVYVHDLDMVFTFMSIDEQKKEPWHDYFAEQYSLYKEMRLEEKRGLYLNIELVDNEDLIGVQFTNVFGEVYEIIPIKDSFRKSGFYVTRSNKHGEVDRVEEVLDFHTFEEMKSIYKVYSTRQEAATFGDPETQRKIDLANKEIELAEMKESLKTKDIELAKQAKILDEIKSERELRKMAETDYYDRRSFDRKDSSEAFKILPALVVGIGALLMGIKSIFF